MTTVALYARYSSDSQSPASIEDQFRDHPPHLPRLRRRHLVRALMNGSCANSRSIPRTAIEERVLTGLKDRLMAPEIAAEAIRAYAEETNRLNRDRRSSGEVERRELDKVERALKEIVTAIEDGGYSRLLMGRLHALEARQDELKARLSQAPLDGAAPPALPPTPAPVSVAPFFDASGAGKR